MAQNEKILAGVLEIFRHNPQKQFRVDQIEREARRDRLGNFTELIKALSFLEHDKKIITDGKGQYQLAQENTEDVFVAADYTKYVVNGDRVKVKITAGGNPWNGKGPEGQVEEILEHGLETLVGEFHPLTDEQRKISHFIGYALSNDKKLHK